MQKNESKNKARCWAVIPAAGSSQRMGAELPKQYLPINDLTVIEASLSCFQRHPNIAGIVVALHKNDRHWKSLAVAKDASIHTVTGGATRANSVYAAINKLLEIAKEDDFVLVHDAARPCLSFKDLDTLIKQLQNDEVGGILATKVVDTIKKSHHDRLNVVKSTVDRSRLWKALTPQMFRISILKNALQHCLKNNIKVTDEASAVEELELEVKLIEGRSDNIKITQQEDLQLADFILKNPG